MTHAGFTPALSRRHWRAFDLLLLAVMGTCLGFLAGVAFTASALAAPPLRCALLAPER